MKTETSITLILAVTSVALLFLMTRCNILSNEELTKRQQIVVGTTNRPLEKYVPIP